MEPQPGFDPYHRRRTVAGRHKRLWGLLLKTVESALGVIVFFMHAGELHVLSSLSTSRFGMFYTTTTSALPIYLVARASSAIWERPWVAWGLDALINFCNAFIYACCAVALSWSLDGAEDFYASHIDVTLIPKQRTSLNQRAAWFRFFFAIILSILLLLEGLAALFFGPITIINAILKKIKKSRPKADDVGGEGSSVPPSHDSLFKGAVKPN